ncbi:hypothetical protein [Sphaerisporangium fuscum]|uniref:hypothetical protein n=1 Tax=Sphaerisporangium fuscum TaxID=2835868 RepID=UPI001BDCFC80|nr:hypothetical protein [Sphaerisporangium fuscum]
MKGRTDGVGRGRRPVRAPGRGPVRQRAGASGDGAVYQLAGDLHEHHHYGPGGRPPHGSPPGFSP